MFSMPSFMVTAGLKRPAEFGATCAHCQVPVPLEVAATPSPPNSVLATTFTPPASVVMAGVPSLVPGRRSACHVVVPYPPQYTPTPCQTPLCATTLTLPSLAVMGGGETVAPGPATTS